MHLTGISLAVSGFLLFAVPAAAGVVQVWEASQGAPGTTAQYTPGNGLAAAIVLDASSAEGGALDTGVSELEIRPVGTARLVGFDCQLTGCVDGADYKLVPGNASQGAALRVTDPDFSARSGVLPVGTVHFDAPDVGGLELATCNYIGADGVERRCAPFTLVSLPEPGLHAGLAAALLMLAGLGRRRAVAP